MDNPVRGTWQSEKIRVVRLWLVVFDVERTTGDVQSRISAWKGIQSCLAFN